jgi:ABC-type nitrate/sulfonate/bicarbonate transport system substrate-binding protein
MKKIPILIITIVAFTLIFPACERQNHGPDEIIILVPQSVSALPFLALAGKKLGAGTELKIEFFTQHAQALIKLLRGDAQFLFSGTTQGWESYWDGNPIVVVSTYVWGVSSLLVKEGFGDSPAALRGKKISLPFPNSPLDVKTRFLLKQANIDPVHDVFLEYRPFTQAIPLFLDNRIDAIALPEPQASDLVVNKKAKRLFEFRTAWGKALGNAGDSPEVSLFTTAALKEKLRPIILKLHDELADSCAQINADPARYARDFSQTLSFPPVIIEEALKKTAFAAIGFTDHKLKMLEYYQTIKTYFTGKTGDLEDQFFFNCNCPNLQGVK